MQKNGQRIIKKSDHTPVKASIDWVGNEPFVEFQVPIASVCSMPPFLLGRHTLITGTTGAGKTTSVLKPMAVGILQYRLEGCAPTGGLVIDPKSELVAHLRAEVSIAERLIMLGQPATRLSYFEFEGDLSLYERWVSLMRMFESNMLAGDSSHWVAMGENFGYAILQLQDDVMRLTGRDLLARLVAALDCNSSVESHVVDFFKPQKFTDQNFPSPPEETQSSEAVNSFLHSIRLSESRVGPRYKAMCSQDTLTKLRAFLNWIASSLISLKFSSSCIEQIMRRIGLTYPNPLRAYSGNEDVHRQVIYMVQCVSSQLTALTDPGLCRVLDVDPLKFDGVGRSGFSMMTAIDAGAVLVYTPGLLSPESDKKVGAVLRKIFTQYIQRRGDMCQPVAYIADEFHRYASCDTQYGDTIFLSFCRSYRVMTCLCTQSIAALKLALGTTQIASSTGTRAILNNIGTRIMMRSVDDETQSAAVNIYPFPRQHERPHIISVRPLATLATGEYYYVTSDGRYGRTQVRLDVKPDPSKKLSQSFAQERAFLPSINFA